MIILPLKNEIIFCHTHQEREPKKHQAPSECEATWSLAHSTHPKAEPSIEASLAIRTIV